MKTVRSWKELAGELMGWFDYDWDKDGQMKLNAIQRQHVSDEACLKALVEAFLLRAREGKRQPSWRSVIHGLHEAGESQLAEKIKTNAEPHQGEWVEMIHMHHLVIRLPLLLLCSSVCTCSCILNILNSDKHDTMIKPQEVLFTNLFLP